MIYEQLNQQQQQIASYKKQLLFEWMVLYETSKQFQRNMFEGGYNYPLQFDYLSQLGALWKTISVFIDGMEDVAFEKEYMKYVDAGNYPFILFNDYGKMAEMESIIRRAMQKLKITEVV